MYMYEHVREKEKSGRGIGKFKSTFSCRSFHVTSSDEMPIPHIETKTVLSLQP